MPDGEGEHRYLRIEKVDANTRWVAARLADFADVHPKQVGFSGLKDRHSLASQWFSVQLPARKHVDWAAFRAQGVRILEVSANRRKLRRGAHRGNRFLIVVREAAGDAAAVAERLEVIRDRGVPNYFGEQRFGRGGGNMALAESLFAGQRLKRERRELALSAARAWLFNHVLERRVVDGSWCRLRAGDCVGLDGSGSVFPVTAPDGELERRAAALDIHPTGPLWGAGELSVSGDVAALERSVAAEFSDFALGLERAGLVPARRALRLAVQDLQWREAGSSLELSFRLARGAVATAVLRELAD